MATQPTAPQKAATAQQSQMEQNRKQAPQQMDQQLQVSFSKHSLDIITQFISWLLLFLVYKILAACTKIFLKLQSKPPS